MLIRQAVVAQLVDETAAEARVASTRVEPHKKSALPAIAVYTLGETVDVDASKATNPREIVRNSQIEIVGWVAGSDAVAVDVAMDNLAEEIEAAMNLDPYLGGTAADSILEETAMEVLEDDARSAVLVGIVTLTYSVTYRTTTTADAGELDDFLTVNAKNKLVGGVIDTPTVEETFTVQETP